MVILVIRRLVWGITNRGSTVNKYILYIYYIIIYIFIIRYTRVLVRQNLPNLPFTKITIYLLQCNAPFIKNGDIASTLCWLARRPIP